LRNWDGVISFLLDGIEYLQRDFTNNLTTDNLAIGTRAGVNGIKLDADTTHTLRVECLRVDAGDITIDALFAFDDRSEFNMTRPSTDPNQPSFNGTTYTAPELFPANASVSFADVNTRRKLTELEIFQSWNNTTNNASVTLNLGSQSKTVNNPSRNISGNIRETITVTSSNAARTGNIDINLSRFDDAATSDEFPANGDGGQRVDFHNLDGNPDAVTRSNIGEATTRAFFQSGFLTGNTLREAGQKAGGDLLTHSIFADVDPDNDNIIGSEQIKFIPK